ncbi:hypothetical protein HanRHA438_Chr16g0744841 [Helianthus annuus]|uniref:Uncharacterized protein n=1 Tax=Helianthus annuus TaxID=4232 RepID=A0A9K3DP16_HELAN|nr:hypothetical protein HanXRQr2_Chr16g0732291 [Helianthus annuus]KAJ0437002.1 hypothetical protein HanHA300_Chr16g0597071 [Helianthus annuus]KAJ0441324.1 hypothetical protein HanIR_Chr16g0796461 [Helianthus annuus]KAJ0459313.1 hypothetical protein HanHA89_Chr16g0647551 [Helianthus annuus]KAJ0819970.1 hypothetical protein HanPSC8_Chr16g0702291 [Helianthus annuus]
MIRRSMHLPGGRQRSPAALFGPSGFTAMVVSDGGSIGGERGGTEVTVRWSPTRTDGHRLGSAVLALVRWVFCLGVPGWVRFVTGLSGDVVVRVSGHSWVRVKRGQHRSNTGQLVKGSRTRSDSVLERFGLWFGLTRSN